MWAQTEISKPRSLMSVVTPRCPETTGRPAGNARLGSHQLTQQSLLVLGHQRRVVLQQLLHLQAVHSNNQCDKESRGANWHETSLAGAPATTSLRRGGTHSHIQGT